MDVLRYPKGNFNNKNKLPLFLVQPFLNSNNFHSESHPILVLFLPLILIIEGMPIHDHGLPSSISDLN